MKHGRKDYQQRIIDRAALIPADEPVFLLRAKDVHASKALASYIDSLKHAGEHVPAYIESLNAHLERFAKWPVKEKPDTPTDVS